MKMYVKPEMEISKFDVEDVITTSAGNGDVAAVMQSAGFGNVPAANTQVIDVAELLKK